MQDNISCALITAFERQYDTSWDDPKLRNERLAMRYGWTAAMEAKQCLHQIQEPAAAEQAAWHAGLDEGRAQATGSVSNATSQAAPAAVAVPDERADFEAWAKSEDMSIGSDCDGYIHSNTAAASLAWQARAALAATPAAVQTHAEAAAALGINSALTRIRAGNHAEAIAPLEHALRALAATPAADAPAVPKWIDDPHDIEQGQMLNPEWVRQQQPAIMPKGESAAAQLRAMATNYPTGHSWDKLDAKACIRGALEIEALRALLAQAATAAAPAPPAEGVQAVEQGEVLVTVSGFTGSGKSAIAGGNRNPVPRAGPAS